MNITILGSGAFGLALAKSFLINNHITIWSKFEKEVNSLKEKYKEYTFTSNIENALSTSDIIVIAIPIEDIGIALGEASTLAFVLRAVTQGGVRIDLLIVCLA